MIREKAKAIIKRTICLRKIILVRNIYLLSTNHFKDLILYFKHSTVFSQHGLNKNECQLILDYHSVEKGLLFKEVKPRFAKERINRIHCLLNIEVIKNNIRRTQIKVAYQVLCEYYELHKRLDVDISDYFTDKQYSDYKKILGKDYDSNFKGAIDYTRTQFYEKHEENFHVFSNTRKSVREYTGEIIPNETIEQAIKLALNTPSVCNRQASKVYLLDDKDRIDKLLKIQGGLSGYSKNINQLLILTVDRNYFYTVGERNQFYIDGGMFLMNMLYALHYYKIANCPANWGKTIQEESLLRGIVDLPLSEKIICVVSIGVANDEFRVTLSQRRDVSEVLIYI